MSCKYLTGFRYKNHRISIVEFKSKNQYILIYPPIFTNRYDLISVNYFMECLGEEKFKELSDKLRILFTLV